MARGPLLGAGALALAALMVAATAPAPAHPFPDETVDEYTESEACWRQAARAYARYQAPAGPSAATAPALAAEPAAAARLAASGADVDAPARTWLHRGAALGDWDPAPPHALDDATLAETLLDVYAAQDVAVTPDLAAETAAFAGDLDPRVRAHLAPLVSRLAHALDHHEAAYPADYPATDAAVDQAQLVHAADGLLLTASTQAPALRALPAEAWPDEPVRDPVGVLAVGSMGDDVYTVDRFLQVDPGGEDDFQNNAGGGAAFVGLDISEIRIQEVALHLDLGGDDLYGFLGENEGAQPYVAQGGGQDGVGVMVDWGGNDTYRANSRAQGGVFRSGAGIAWDRAGDDDWWAGDLSNGAGSGGLGLLLDGRGDDSYEVGFDGLGFGKFRGVGLHSDSAGTDTYAGSLPLVGWGENNSHGVFLDDGEGDDAYPFDGNSWAADGATWAHQDVGVGCDDG